MSGTFNKNKSCWFKIDGSTPTVVGPFKYLYIAYEVPFYNKLSVALNTWVSTFLNPEWNPERSL